jgi:hypothetical protein
MLSKLQHFSLSHSLWYKTSRALQSCGTRAAANDAGVCSCRERLNDNAGRLARTTGVDLDDDLTGDSEIIEAEIVNEPVDKPVMTPGLTLLFSCGNVRSKSPEEACYACAVFQTPTALH